VYVVVLSAAILSLVCVVGCEEFNQVMSVLGVDTAFVRSLLQQLTTPSLSA